MSDIVERLNRGEGCFAEAADEITALRSALAISEQKRADLATACEEKDTRIVELVASIDKAESEAHDIGLADGRAAAIQEIDVATGGDGEYRFCTDLDPDRHTPDLDTMKARIVERFVTLKASIADMVSETGWVANALASTVIADQREDIARDVIKVALDKARGTNADLLVDPDATYRAMLAAIRAIDPSQFRSKP